MNTLQRYNYTRKKTSIASFFLKHLKSKCPRHPTRMNRAPRHCTLHLKIGETLTDTEVRLSPTQR